MHRGRPKDGAGIGGGGAGGDVDRAVDERGREGGVVSAH